MFMYHKTLADGFFIFAVLAIFSAMVGWAIGDIWLASTQWMLVAVVMMLMAIFVRINAEEDEKILQTRAKTVAKKGSRAKSSKASKHVSFKLTKE